MQNTKILPVVHSQGTQKETHQTQVQKVTHSLQTDIKVQHQEIRKLKVRKISLYQDLGVSFSDSNN